MKAILVIDVPVLDDGRHLCNECPIWNKEHCFCQYDFNMEAKGCPLRPLPEKQKQPVSGALFLSPQEEIDYNYGFIDGYNALLMELVRNRKDSNE